VPAPGGWRGWAGCQLVESAWGCRHPWLAVPATGVGPSAASAMRGGSQFSCWSEWGSGPAGTGAGTVPVLKTTYWGTSVCEGLHLPQTQGAWAMRVPSPATFKLAQLVTSRDSGLGWAFRRAGGMCWHLGRRAGVERLQKKCLSSAGLQRAPRWSSQQVEDLWVGSEGRDVGRAARGTERPRVYARDP